VSRAARARDTERVVTFMFWSFLPVFPCCFLKQPEKTRRDAADIRSEACPGEVEPENYAHRGVPYFQARVAAQDEYRRTQCHDCRER
jgi:hypothetical protein